MRLIRPAGEQINVMTPINCICYVNPKGLVGKFFCSGLKEGIMCERGIELSAMIICLHLGVKVFICHLGHQKSILVSCRAEDATKY